MMNRFLSITVATVCLACTTIAVRAGQPSNDEDGGSRLESVSEQLSGTWRAETGDGGAVMMMITPVEIEGLEHAMYAESVRADAPWDPFRQAVFSLYDYKDKIRLRTYELAMGDVAKGVFDGMGAAPDRFPTLGSEELIATIDIELEIDGTGFAGSTPYPYPTGVGDAVEMTSSITYDGRTLTTADRGYDADGEIVWGADADSVYEFEPADPYAVSG